MLTILMSSFSWSGYAQGNKPAEKVAVRIEKTVESEKETAEKKITRLEAQLKVVKAELSVIRKELAEVLKESDEQDVAYARIQMSIAASLAEGDKKSYNKESAELLKALMEVSGKGEKLVLASAEFCDFVEILFDKKDITDVEKVRAKFRMDKLRSTAEIFHARIKTPPKGTLFKSCRILAVNDKLQIVVLGVGSVYGMRNGIIVRGGKNKEILLRVIAVRPFISGAIVTEGSIEKLSPGMVIHAGQ